MGIFTPHGSVVINAAREFNNLNFEVAVAVEHLNLPIISLCELVSMLPTARRPASAAIWCLY